MSLSTVAFRSLVAVVALATVLQVVFVKETHALSIPDAASSLAQELDGLSQDAKARGMDSLVADVQNFLHEERAKREAGGKGKGKGQAMKEEKMRERDERKAQKKNKKGSEDTPAAA